MCGRYLVEGEEPRFRALLRQAGLWEQRDWARGEEICPTGLAPLVLPRGRVAAGVWGFPAPAGKGVIIHARSETAAQKPLFRQAVRTGRCLVPASGYFEWRPSGRRKEKFALSLPGQGLAYFAGLWRDWGPEKRFVILTRAAGAGIAFIHDRMPVILNAEDGAAWLDGADEQEVWAKAIRLLAYALVETKE